jgi:hypothetical protein
MTQCMLFHRADTSEELEPDVAPVESIVNVVGSPIG